MLSRTTYTSPMQAQKKCSVCERPFVPARPLQRVCGMSCARKVPVKAKKEEREKLKARKEALKSYTELESECRKIVQAIARIRDKDDGCISCHMGPDYDGQWHGSHFRPAGNHPAVQFHLWNIHKACAQCNLFKGGNIAGYRPRIIAKMGQERVDWLERQNHIIKHNAAYRAYLMRFKKVMGKRLRRMEKIK